MSRGLLATVTAACVAFAPYALLDPAQAATTVKSSKSNSSDRMGGGGGVRGGGGSPAGVINLNSSRSNKN
jgi:hypothetical protein